MNVSTYFASWSNWLAKWTGSHWAFSIAAVAVAASLTLFGIEKTNIAISVVTLLMLFILQNTQNRDSAALHLKLDEIITHLRATRQDGRDRVEDRRGDRGSSASSGRDLISRRTAQGRREGTASRIQTC